jgi:hypothetical protein
VKRAGSTCLLVVIVVTVVTVVSGSKLTSGGSGLFVWDTKFVSTL